MSLFHQVQAVGGKDNNVKSERSECFSGDSVGASGAVVLKRELESCLRERGDGLFCAREKVAGSFRTRSAEKGSFVKESVLSLTELAQICCGSAGGRSS